MILFLFIGIILKFLILYKKEDLINVKEFAESLSGYENIKVEYTSEYLGRHAEGVFAWRNILASATLLTLCIYSTI